MKKRITLGILIAIVLGYRLIPMAIRSHFGGNSTSDEALAGLRLGDTSAFARGINDWKTGPPWPQG